MRRTLLPFVITVLLGWPALIAAQDAPTDGYFSPDQLDNLVAPIALYPDPLLAQVLVAATFPDQIDEASRFVRDDPNAEDIDAQGWDVSVKAVAHYGEVLEMMADKLDWTTALGEAYVNQSADVMAAVQRLRAQAQAAGNLVSTPEMDVESSGGDIEIWPAQPEYIYVPEYDPAVVFFRRAPLFFRARFLIGAWLNLDFEWNAHRIFYHGWEGNRGWIERSRRFVHPTNIYVDNRYRNVVVNREVVHRRVNFTSLNRYDDIHRQTTFTRVRDVHQAPPRTLPEPLHETLHNKIITRNFDTNDPRLTQYRGRPPQPPAKVELPKTPAFTPSGGVFDAHATSQRGRISLSHMPAPPPPKPEVKRSGRERK